MNETTQGFKRAQQEELSMGCFDSKNNSSSASSNKNPRNPEDKPYEWFMSEVGLSVFEETMTVKNFTNDEIYEQEQKDKGVEYFSVYCSVYRKEHKSPRLYFEALVSAVAKLPGASDALLYVWPIESAACVLGLQAKPFYSDDNGDPVMVEPKPDGRQINDINVNPVLKFIRDFHIFSFENKEFVWKEMALLWSDVLWFILRETTEHGVDWDVIGNNPWIFEKDTYLTQAGTLRSRKGLLTTGLEKSTNPGYFKDHLADL